MPDLQTIALSLVGMMQLFRRVVWGFTRVLSFWTEAEREIQGLLGGAKLQSTVQLLMDLHPVQLMMDFLILTKTGLHIIIISITETGAFTMITQVMISTCNSQLYLNRAPMLWSQVSLCFLE